MLTAISLAAELVNRIIPAAGDGGLSALLIPAHLEEPVVALICFEVLEDVTRGAVHDDLVPAGVPNFICSASPSTLGKTVTWSKSTSGGGVGWPGAAGAGRPGPSQGYR